MIDCLATKDSSLFLICAAFVLIHLHCSNTRVYDSLSALKQTKTNSQRPCTAWLKRVRLFLFCFDASHSVALICFLPDRRIARQVIYRRHSASSFISYHQINVDPSHSVPSPLMHASSPLRWYVDDAVLRSPLRDDDPAVSLARNEPVVPARPPPSWSTITADSVLDNCSAAAAVEAMSDGYPVDVMSQ